MQKKLTIASFERAKEFLATEARPLEWHLFEFHFGNDVTAKARVIQALRQFQNTDGGFGNGLEPDVRLPDSSVVATKFALQTLIDIAASVEEPLVKNGIDYLLANYDQKQQVWPLVPTSVMRAPHAPWWNVADLEENFGGYQANPKAGVLRCLLTYRVDVPDDFIHEITETVMAHFQTLPIEMPFFDAISYLMLWQAQALEVQYQETLLAKLEKTAQTLVSKNSEEWLGFAHKPLWLAPSPKAPLARILAEVVQRNLDFEIDYQNADGSWSPTWSWGDSYPEHWQMAAQEWQGILTLAMLRSLRDYDRIAGYEPTWSSYKYHID